MARLDRWIRVLRLRLRSLISRDRVEQELADELAFHQEQETSRHTGLGLSGGEAEAATRRAMYGVEAFKDACRDMRRIQWIEDAISDVRYALRTFRRSPGFVAVAVATLAIGIGVNSAVFTVTNAVIFRGYRLVDENDRLVYISSHKNQQYSGVSYPDFLDWREQARSFAGMGAVASDFRITLKDKDGYAESYMSTRVSAGTFRLLGQQPIIGRDFAPSDETPGAPPVAILSYSFWHRRYNKDPAIVGQTVNIDNNSPTTIIGVMPEGFAFPENQPLWLSFAHKRELERRDARLGMLWFVIGRLADGITMDQARSEMEAIGHRLERAYPRTNEDQVPELRRFTEAQVGPNARTIYTVMWAAVGLVLLIACANVANLLMARTTARAPELAVRMALGAGRWRIVRQLMVESVLLSGLGGLWGWVIAQWAVRTYALAANPPADQWNHNLLDYSMDLTVLAYLVAISIGAAVMCGLAALVRLSSWTLHTVAKEGGRTAAGGIRLSWALVVAEVALTVVLLGGAGVMTRSFLNFATGETGVRIDNTWTTRLQLPQTKYPDREALIAFFERLKRRLEAIPGVVSVSFANALPGGKGGSSITASRSYEIAASDRGDGGRRRTTAVMTIGPEYFQTVGATLLSGREFNDTDGTSRAISVIVNEQLATRHWPEQDAVGQRLRLFDGDTPGPWLSVVGVATNIMQRRIDEGTTNTGDALFLRHEMPPLVYLPYGNVPYGAAPRFMQVFMKTQSTIGDLRAEVRRELSAMDPDLAWLEPLQRVSERIAAEAFYTNLRNYAALFMVFAAVALALASIGLCAVMTYSVSRRTQEIGVRIAIGASARQVLRLIFKEGMLPVAIGLPLGLVASVTVNRLLTSQLVQVSPSDPLALTLAAIVLLASAAYGCWIPARRAMSVDPIVALRHD